MSKQQWKYIIMTALMATTSAYTAPLCDGIVEHNKTVDIIVPQQPLAPHSLQITTPQNKRFADWTKEEHHDSLKAIQKVIRVWKKQGIAEHYALYGREKFDESPAFQWEIVPYPTATNFLSRNLRVFLVIWKTAFGSSALSDSNRQQICSSYSSWFSTLSSPSLSSSTAQRSNDPFCNDDIIKSQIVIEGTHVNVLLNYATIGSGKEKLHFLVVPKEHRSTPLDMTDEEYSEAVDLSNKLIKHFSQTKPSIKEIFFINNTGKDSGQSVPHWHLHLIFSSADSSTFAGKFNIAKGRIFRSAPMNKEALEERVSSLRKELEKSSSLIPGTS